MKQNQRNINRVVNEYTIVFDPDIHKFFIRDDDNVAMDFNRVFVSTSTPTNVKVFESDVRPLVRSVAEGYNSLLFMYRTPRITILAIQELFQRIDMLTDVQKLDISVSYLEVNNVQVIDLLPKSGPLNLVDGLISTRTSNIREVLSLLALGNKNHTKHPPYADSEGNRYNAIFQVHIRMMHRVSGKKRTSKLSMVDLAGSKRDPNSECIGQRFMEGVSKSLLTLGNCINNFVCGSKHITKHKHIVIQI